MEVRRVLDRDLVVWSDGARVVDGKLAYVSLFGPRNAVRALWAKLVAKKDSTIQIADVDDAIGFGGERYVTMTAPLPPRDASTKSDSMHLVSVHVAATNQLGLSAKAFFVIAQRGEDPADAWWPMFARMSAIPMRRTWRRALWCEGVAPRNRDDFPALISEAKGFGMSAHRVVVDDARWIAVLTRAHAEGKTAALQGKKAWVLDDCVPKVYVPQDDS